MKKILIDTNAYAAFKKNDASSVAALRSMEFIGVSIIVLGELLSGFSGGSREAANRKELDDFLDSPRVSLLPPDEETAEFYARIYWDMKRKGRPIPANDLWIAATAMRHGLALLTFDEHFESIDGLLLHR